jgi:MoaA/NifB/PqqE/SkfB family radical SAM enzyme
MNTLARFQSAASEPLPLAADVEANPSPFPVSEWRLKNPRPSESMLPSIGLSYQCPWIEDSITIHADGNVSCGLDDPHARRSFGNVYEQSIAEIYANPEFDRLRENLRQGRRCNGCNLFQPVHHEEQEPPAERKHLPSTIVVETTVKCNLRCDNAACVPNNAPGLLTRHSSHLDVAKFTDVVGQLKDTLATVYFFNYGEPFLHPQAEDMLLHLRKTCPAVRVVTSTNGIPLAKASRAEKVVLSAIDSMTFTIGGITQQSYGRYHANGQVGLALQGLQNICEAKARESRDKPAVIWRYLVFRWNDTESEIDAAIALSKLYGVDQFCLYLTHMPANSSSYRLAPGSPLFEKYRKYIDFVHGFDCVFPDEYGFYGVEDIQGLGRARWSCWRAAKTLHRNGNCLRLALSTNRPGMQGHECIVRTPWTSVRVVLSPMQWRDVSLLIPWKFRDTDEFSVEIIAPNAWYPVEEIGNQDLRCLGVLVREDPPTSSDDADALCFSAGQGCEAVTAFEETGLGPFGDRGPLPQLQNNSGRYRF